MGFGKFKDKSKKNSFVALSTQNQQPSEDTYVRVRLPQGKEIIGVITQRCGGSRMIVSCMDGKIRNCRVPGRNRRGLWLREGDVIIIEPWEFDSDKGDVLFKYTPIAATKLKAMGKLNTEANEF
jgi:translation initiation factor 1A